MILASINYFNHSIPLHYTYNMTATVEDCQRAILMTQTPAPQAITLTRTLRPIMIQAEG